MKFKILFSPPVLRTLDRADSPLRKKLDRCFAQLGRDPFHHNNIKRLTGEFAGLYRFRIGDWRVVYRINETNLTVVIIDIGHRRDVYE
jgi:mRNA interferase RelE/StbE